MRANNNSQHISSKADAVILDPTKTAAFESTIIDLQLMANAISDHATKPLPVATETVSGIGELATLDEVIAGTDKTKIVTPFTLHTKMSRPNATESVYGLVRYSTVAEREEAAAQIDLTVSTSTLWDVLRTKSISAEGKRGTMSISTLTAAKGGVDDTTAMTPMKVKAAIDTFAVTSISGASETTSGTVKNAASPITNAALHEGYAVTPKGFINTRASQSQVGTIRMATQAEANARSIGDVAISPATLPIASDSQYGITALLHGAAANVTNKALSAHGATLFINRYGDSMAGDLIATNVYSAVGQSGRGDALTRKDYVDGQVGSRSPKGHGHGTLIESWTHIWAGPLDRGNFTMNQPWWNFDAIVVEGSADRGGYYNSNKFSKQQIESMMNRYGEINLLPCERLFWYGRFDSSGRTFIPHAENSYLWNIFGVKYTVA